MTWFDPDTDWPLLHESVRDSDERINAIEKAEFDIFNAYTEYDSCADEYIVKLRGYNEDPEQADPKLVQAVKETVADLVSYRLRAYGNAQEVASQRQGNRSWSFFRESPAWDSFPKNWQYKLRVFDTRTVLYHA